MNESIFRLAVEGMKGEKRNSILRVLILFLSFTFITVSLSVTASLNKTGEEYRYSQYGEWRSALLDATASQKEKLENSPSIERVGTVQIGGVVVDANGSSMTAIGSVDEEFVEMGRISLQAGKLPQEANEIAMEADVLSALGYDYTLGQKIVFCIQRGKQTIESEYTLCGVIKEYTDIWSRGEELLAGAIVCHSEVEEMGGVIKHQYFLMSDKTNAQLMREFGREYSFTANESMRDVSEQTEVYWRFVAVILVTTVVSVGSIYFVQMNERVRSFALLRTIGATRKQIIKKMFYETCCTTVPAIFGGTIVGAAVTWAVLSVVFTIDKANFRLVIPVGDLALAVVIWLLTITSLQMLVLFWAFRQPLVGRITQNPHRVRKNKWSKNLGITALAGIFLATGMIVYLQALSYGQMYHTWENVYDYIVEAQGERYVTEEILQEIEEILGVEDLLAVRQLQASVTFSGMEESELVIRIKENGWHTQPWLTDSQVFPQGMGVYIYGIREADIEDFLVEINASIEKEAFIQGEKVILWFGNEEGLCRARSDIGIDVGDEITLNLYATGEMSEAGYSMLENPIVVGEQTVTVGEILLEDMQETTYVSFGGHYYSVFASEKFVQDLLEDGAGTGKILNTGDAMGVGFSWAQIKAGADAAYLSTDYTISGIVQSTGNKFGNYRERHAGLRQEAQLGLVFLLLSGVCMGTIMLMLIWNILVSASREERKRYGILQALGMSKRQMLMECIGKGALLCVMAMIPAMGLCKVYVDSAPTDISHLGIPLTEFAVICSAMFCFLLVFYVAIQIRMLRGTPMQLISEEGR